MFRRKRRSRMDANWQTVAGSLWGGAIAGGLPTGIAVIAGVTGFNTGLVSLIPTAGTLGTVPVGATEITEIDAHIDFVPTVGVAATTLTMALGLYVAEYSTGAGGFATQQAIAQNDAERDNWMVLRRKTTLLPAAAVQGTPISFDFSFKWKGKVVVQEGEQLSLAFQCVGVSGLLWPYLRFKQRKVF